MHRIASRLKSKLYGAIDGSLRTFLRRVPVSATTERIALWWGYRFRPKLGWIKLRSGASLYTAQIDHLQLLLYYLGTFEPHCLEVLRNLLWSGATVLDVGANIGLFTVEAAHLGAKVIAIEAAPQHVESITRSVKRNRFCQVEILSCAVGDQDGNVTLSLPQGANYGMFTLGKVASDQTMIVPIRRIDDVVGDRRIDFIKMDIEGSEYRALLGAKRTLIKDHPPIMIELNDGALQACGSSSQEVKQLLFSLGYEGKIITTGQRITLDQEHECDECLFQSSLSP